MKTSTAVLFLLLLLGMSSGCATTAKVPVVSNESKVGIEESASESEAVIVNESEIKAEVKSEKERVRIFRKASEMSDCFCVGEGSSTSLLDPELARKEASTRAKNELESCAEIIDISNDNKPTCPKKDAEKIHFLFSKGNGKIFAVAFYGK